MRLVPVQINGWTMYAHPLFLDQVEQLVHQVEAARKRDPAGYKSKRAAKFLSAILKIAFEILPEDPSRSAYRQGDTLGPQHRHWLRVKFFQQYRLFFRYRSGDARMIILAWVNDDKTLRAYGSKTDAYAVFSKMLAAGNPPDNWEALRTLVMEKEAQQRLATAFKNL